MGCELHGAWVALRVEVRPRVVRPIHRSQNRESTPVDPRQRTDSPIKEIKLPWSGAGVEWF